VQGCVQRRVGGLQFLIVMEHSEDQKEEDRYTKHLLLIVVATEEKRVWMLYLRAVLDRAGAIERVFKRGR